MRKETKARPVFKIRADYAVTNRDGRSISVIAVATGGDQDWLHSSAWYAIKGDLRNFGIDPEKCEVEPLGAEYFAEYRNEWVAAVRFAEGAELEKAIKRRVYLPSGRDEAAEIYG